MSAESIYKALRAEGMSHAGACGMLGNMMAESGMKAEIAQRGMTSVTDREYTELYDAAPEKCIYDGVGYGLCQWTYHSRKRKLSEFSKVRGISVSDENMQACFVIEELKTDYPGLWEYLRSCADSSKAAEKICREYERPAVNNIAVRAGYAAEFERQFAGENNTDKLPCDPSVLMMQFIFRANGYAAVLDGRKTRAFFDMYYEFGRDMESC